MEPDDEKFKALYDRLTMLRKENDTLNDLVLRFIHEHSEKSVTDSEDYPLKKCIEYKLAFDGGIYRIRHLIDIDMFFNNFSHTDIDLKSYHDFKRRLKNKY